MDATTIYQRLAQFLSNDLPASIEILPGSETQWSTAANPHFPFLFDGRNLGIPQSTLYQAYIYAVKLLPRLPKLDLKTVELDAGYLSDLISSTSIILLANPAHNTALNRRKQLLEIDLPSLTPHHELNFMAALLGMKEASKSSILWHHRRWVLRRMYVDPSSLLHLGSDKDHSDTLIRALIPHKTLTAEFDLAARASEIYPRNYHAWLHRHICMRCLIASENSPGVLAFLRTEAEVCQRWVELHVSDYTAMQYVASLKSALNDSGIDVTFRNPTFDTLSLLASYPVHESLWLYLRFECATTCGQNLTSYQWLVDFALSFLDISSRNETGQPLGDRSDSKAFAERVLAAARGENITLIREYALRLFIWAQVLMGKLKLDEVFVRHLRMNIEHLDLNHLRRLCAV